MIVDDFWWFFFLFVVGQHSQIQLVCRGIQNSKKSKITQNVLNPMGTNLGTSYKQIGYVLRAWERKWACFFFFYGLKRVIFLARTQNVGASNSGMRDRPDPQLMSYIHPPKATKRHMFGGHNPTTTMCNRPCTIFCSKRVNECKNHGACRSTPEHVRLSIIYLFLSIKCPAP